jgi:hypothetical protein
VLAVARLRLLQLLLLLDSRRHLRSVVVAGIVDPGLRSYPGGQASDRLRRKIPRKEFAWRTTILW